MAMPVALSMQWSLKKQSAMKGQNPKFKKNRKNVSLELNPRRLQKAVSRGNLTFDTTTKIQKLV